ncbi:MAG: hypothetical protein IJ364_03375 [Oscillospiraceae bacterium]|nr:hypothetical protein [Oscillospiraceae bacterium]
MDTVFLTDSTRDGGWIDGQHKDGYSFSAKVYDNGSKHGIRRGRVSKLFIDVDSTGETVVCYDRRWQLKPAPEVKQAYADILKFLETMPISAF